MNGSFDDCGKDYRYRIDEEEIINLLLNSNMRNYIIGNDDISKGVINIESRCLDDCSLLKILENRNNYSEAQLENIFSNLKNILVIINSEYFGYLYKDILNLNYPILNKIYMSNEFLLILRDLNRLDRIYEVINDIKIDVKPIMLNSNSLIDIGETVINGYKKNSIGRYCKMPTFDDGIKYGGFFLCTHYLEDKNLLFEVLDFYLTNTKYLSTFYILRNSLKLEDLQEYFNGRKEVITRIIKQNDNDNIMFILGGLPYEVLTNEFSKERENAIIYCNSEEYYYLFNDYFQGSYRLDDNILCNDRFAEKFSSYNYYGNLDREQMLKLASSNEELIEEIVNKIKSYDNMKKEITDNLNDNKDEFKTYIQILMNSGIDVYSIDFLKDMIDVIFFNRRIKEVSYKYNSKNLEKIKLDILNELVRISKENIASSITNPLDKNIIYLEYTLDGKIISVPTIIYDNEVFTFFVRRMNTGNHINDDNYEEKIECYSTITEKNRSIFYGNSGVKFGYIEIKPEDIVQINSFDAISQNSRSNKYSAPYIKYPEWISMEELNRRTLQNRSYNEIRVKGKYIPDFVISYDEPNEQTLRYSYEHNAPMVKILRKCYPKAIEECDDPYSNWH